MFVFASAAVAAAAAAAVVVVVVLTGMNNYTHTNKTVLLCHSTGK